MELNFKESEFHLTWSLSLYHSSGILFYFIFFNSRSTCVSMSFFLELDFHELEFHIKLNLLELEFQKSGCKDDRPSNRYLGIYWARGPSENIK